MACLFVCSHDCRSFHRLSHVCLYEVRSSWYLSVAYLRTRCDVVARVVVVVVLWQKTTSMRCR